MDFSKMLGLDPNSEEAKLFQDVTADSAGAMFDSLLNSEMGKKIASMLPLAMEGLKKDLGDDDKMYMVRKNRETGNPVFYVIDVKKIESFNVSEGAIMVGKEIDNPVEMLKSLFGINISPEKKHDSLSSQTDQSGQ